MLRKADSLKAGKSMREGLPALKGRVAPRTLLASPTGQLWIEVYDSKDTLPGCTMC